MENKSYAFSGIQPSGSLTIGNYVGTMPNWLRMQEEYNCIFSIVDMHAITVRQEPAVLRQRTLELAALYIACGIDPEKCVLFVQSHVPQHAQLGWILNCYTYMGELSRMTQFKEKSARHEENINAGLFDYPVLMAADILLYQTAFVPVGDDQRQHVELARDIAIRFNNAYSPTFTVPEAIIPKAGARVMSLQEPTKKMSKSDEDSSSVFILDTPDVIRKKFRRAVTDSGSGIVYDQQEKPGISNLIDIYAAFAHCTAQQVEERFATTGYGQFKDAVADVVIEVMAPVQARFAQLMGDKKALGEILANGAQKAARIAAKTLDKVERKVGFVRF